MMKRGRLRMMEEGLASQIAEFSINFSHKDLEDVARSGSSLGNLKTAEQYTKDRELCLQKLLTIPLPKAPECQYSVMLEELELCLKPIYTVKNLPILLNQFYLDRLQELVQLKHMMLLRWTRMAIGRPKITEELAADYHKRIEYLMCEYNDTLNKSRRLSELCSEHVVSAHNMNVMDILPFLRGLVYHQHTTKRATAFIARIQWLPLFHESEMIRAIALVADKVPVDTEVRSLHIKEQQQLNVKDQQQLETAKKWFASQQSGSSLFYGQEKEVESQLLLPPPTIASSLVEYLEIGKTLEVGSQQMPLHQPEVTKNHVLLQELMLNYNIVGPSSFPSTSEELQFFYQVMRKFQTLFMAQENTTHFHTYDKLPEGESHAKLSKSKLTFKKRPNWEPFIKVHPTPDPVWINAYAKIKLAVSEVDPLLSLNSHCTHLHNLQRVLYALKQHSVVVRHPPPFTSLSVTSHKTPHDSLLVWKCVYSGLDSRNPLHMEDYVENPDAEDPDDPQEMGDEGDTGLDMPSALKVILNNGGRNVSSKAQQVSKDAYLGFLLLRHLRIRDLRNKCLYILNFFNSVERTLTINTEGLSLEHNNDQKKKSAGLMDHSYIFKTPLDYKVDQSDFMRFMEVENHDDFYSFWEDGSVQVWDMRGVAVMYTSSLTHLKELEKELLTVASYYIRRVALRDSGKEVHVKRGSEEKEKEELKQLALDNVDRFGIILDLWTCEARYLQAKMRVVNCYLEAYHHTLNAAQRLNLHLSIVSVMRSRPRYDVEAYYFTDIFNKEVKCLEVTSSLQLAIINHQMSEERTYNQLVCCQDLMEVSSTRDEPRALPFGLPLPLIAKQPVSLTGDRHLQVHSYLLEFSESLCVLGNLDKAFRWALTEASTLLYAESTKEILALHCRLLELALNDWVVSADIGTSHATEVYSQLLCDGVVENPNAMVDAFLTHSNKSEPSLVGATPVENKLAVTKSWINFLHLISLRQHLLHTCLESEYLARLYKHQLVQLDYEDCHTHLRCINFDLTLRFPTDKKLDQFISQARDEVKGGNPRP